MKNNVYFGIVFRIIILFFVAMLMTFIPDHLREFFGDTLVQLKYSSWGELVGDGSIDIHYNWGARHYWYFNMMILLFIVSLINVIISIRNLIIKEYPDVKW